MREIKFRYYQSPGYGESKFNIIEYTLDQLEHGKVERLMLAQKTHYGIVGRVQYTGLKDKNGKEIYEGDIITWNCKGSVIHGRVYHGRDGWWISDARRGNTTRAGKASTISVIGNIYENPELLEK